jgi:phosphatidylinositol alpha-mannosyltransferase
MKIAMTHVDLPNETKGGVAAQAHLLANTLVDRGHDVTMYTFSPKFADCRYYVHQYLAPKQLGNAKSFLFAWRLSRTDFSQFDVIHTHGDNYLLRGNVPLVRTFHGSAMDEAKSARTMRRRLYQHLIARLEVVGGRVADVSVGVSEATRVRIPAVTAIIPCGVDLTRFQPGSKSAHPTLLFVGTIGGRKRGALLAEIFQKEIRPGLPDSELWMVADHPIAGEGIVNFGRVSEDILIRLFQEAWVFCLPSTYEGFGVPYIEAMAAGTAVVASPNPGAREVLRDGEFGSLPDDDALGQSIAELLGNQALRSNVANIGLSRAQDYNVDSVAAAYERIYQQLAPSSQRRMVSVTQ